MAFNQAACKFLHHVVQLLLVSYRCVQHRSALRTDQMIMTVQSAIKTFGVGSLYLMDFPILREKVQVPIDGAPADFSIGGVDVYEELVRLWMVMPLPYSVKYQLALF